MEEKLKNILKSSFMQNFYMERVATDLMDLVEKIEKLAKESNRNRNEMIQMLLTYAVDRAEVRHEETTK